MVSIDQIEQGVAGYLDGEILPHLPEKGVEKVLIGMAMGVAIKRSRSFVQMFTENKYIKAFGVSDENGNIDIDILKEELQKQISPNGLDIEIPMLGKMTFHKADVDKLYQYITGAGKSVGGMK